MTRTHGRNASERNTGGGSQDESNSALDKDKSQQSKQVAHRVRLPGFITDEEIGLGDVIKRTSAYLRIKPCGGCERRAAALDRWLAFTHRSRK